MGGCVHLRVWADSAVLGLWGQVGAMSVSRTGEQGASGRSLRQAVRWQSLWAGSVGGVQPGGVLCTQVCVPV